MNISVKLKVEVTGCELFCVKCHTSHVEGNCITDGSDGVFYASFESVVTDEYRCEKCGCNLFDVDVCFKVECQ